MARRRIVADPVARAELRRHQKDCTGWRESVAQRFNKAEAERTRMHEENSNAILKTQQKIDSLETTIREDKAVAGKRENKFLRWLVGAMFTGICIMAWWIITHGKP